MQGNGVLPFFNLGFQGFLDFSLLFFQFGNLLFGLGLGSLHGKIHGVLDIVVVDGGGNNLVVVQGYEITVCIDVDIGIALRVGNDILIIPERNEFGFFLIILAGNDDTAGGYKSGFTVYGHFNEAVMI